MLIGSVEQVDLVRVESELNSILRTCSASRRYSGGERDTLAGEVQECLSTEHFGYVNSSLDHTGLSGGEEHLLIVNVLRTDTEDNFLVYIVLQTLVVSLCAC